MKYTLRVVAALVVAGGCVFDQGGVVREQVDDAGADVDAPTGGAADAASAPDADPLAPDADPTAPDASTSTPDAAAGTPDAAAPVDAMPGDPDAGCVTECVGGQWRDCSAGGVLVDCPLGCVPTGTPHCGELVPSNGAEASHLDGVTNGLSLLSGEIGGINTDNGGILIGSTTVRGIGSGVVAGMGFYPLSDGLAVLAVDSFELEAASRFRVIGARALIILSRGDVTLDGLLDVGGGCLDRGTRYCGGPGGGRGARPGSASTGCAAGANGGGGSGIPESGGGGGGFGSAGGDGGDASGSVLGGAGGAAGAPCTGASLVPLTGGSGGGRGFNVTSGNGGGGGGGVQVTSLTAIRAVGTPGPGDPSGVWAGGAGGNGGGGGDGGGGGGSGGAILLEAPVVALSDATVTANGGGGGDGNSGGDGEYATANTNPASGGGTAPQTRGGAGAARDVAAEQGGGVGDGAGGGGGGVGIIRFNVPAAGLSISTTAISPAHTRGNPTVQ